MNFFFPFILFLLFFIKFLGNSAADTQFSNSEKICAALESYHLKQPALSLELIPEVDKIKIEHLFEYLLLEGQFSYTVFGNKPVSTIGFIKQIAKKNLKPVHSEGICAYFIQSEKWKVWKKYRDRFPMKNFSLIENDGPSHLELYLINRPACLDKIKQHLKIFHQILGVELTPQQILHKLESSHNFMREGLNGSQVLYGILLGYGEQNARGFENFVHKKMYFLKYLGNFNSESRSAPYLIQLPYFIIFEEDNETIRLKLEYTKTQQAISKLVADGHFVEAALDKMMSH